VVVVVVVLLVVVVLWADWAMSVGQCMCACLRACVSECGGMDGVADVAPTAGERTHVASVWMSQLRMCLSFEATNE
jgi:hypothetical protein